MRELCSKLRRTLYSLAKPILICYSAALACMALRLAFRADRQPVTVHDGPGLDEILNEASKEARIRNLLGGVLITADNHNEITIVVGGEETVLTFESGDGNPPYYASRGTFNADETTMTCYLLLQHHTEFPRRNVIPFADGFNAVREFLVTGARPACINWERV